MRRAIQPDLPLVQHNDAVGEARDALQFLRGHHDGDLVPVGQLGQHVEHGRFAGGIQAGGRLVEHQHLRPHRQHRRDGDALLLAARQQQRRTVPILGQPDRVQRPGQPLLDLSGRDAQILAAERDLVLDAHLHDLALRILEDQADGARQIGHEMLFGVLAEDRHIAAKHAAGDVGHQPIERHAEGRLPRADAAEQGHELPALDLEVDPLEHGNRLIALGQRRIGVEEVLDEDIWGHDVT